MGKTKRDANIELIRIVAIIMVISLHIWQGSGIDEISVYIKGVMRAFQRNGVPLFFMIMGFFLFDWKRSYKEKIVGTLKKVVLPALLTMLVTYICADWVRGDRTFFECFRNISLDGKGLLVNILNWQAAGEYDQHLWYVFSYFKIILWFPILQMLCTGSEQSDKARHFTMAVCFVQMLLENGQYIFVNAWSLPAQIKLYSPIDYTVLYVLLGYELRILIKKETQINKLVLLGGYFVGNLGVCAMQFFALKLGAASTYFDGTNNVFILISSISVFLFLYQIELGNSEKTICYIGDKVFYIYLLYNIFAKHLPANRFIRIFDSWPSLLQYVVCIIHVFVVSLVLAIIIKNLTTILDRIKGNRYEKNK